MGMTNRRILGIFFLLSALSIQAATVAVQVVESGPSLESGFIESSSAWEYAVMDALFDAGHIVSNAPIRRLDTGILNSTAFMADTMQGVVEAKNGGADLLILVLLEYKNPAPTASQAGQAGSPAIAASSSTTTRLSPSLVEIRCKRLNPVKLIAQETSKDILQSRTGLEDQKNAAALMRNIISRLKER
jgi:hypothetical protein